MSNSHRVGMKTNSSYKGGKRWGWQNGVLKHAVDPSKGFRYYSALKNSASDL